MSDGKDFKTHSEIIRNNFFDKTSPKHYLNNSHREEFLLNYEELIPDIKEFCEYKSKGKVDYSFINKEKRENRISNNLRNLFFSIVDIRNNNSPTSTESNAIVKTDNKFSNETKRHVRYLLSKNLTTNQIGYEMINLYGYSAMCSTLYQENIPIKDLIKYYFCLGTEIIFIILGAKFTLNKLFYFLKKRF